ncbi:MAG: M85 family metallopeptidase, partial [Burkholderiaceae bacterium]
MRANDRHAADVRATQIKQSGAAGRLTLQEIDASDRALASAVAHSAHRFSDPHTVGAIRDTLFDTLHGSQTFRSVLAWSLSTPTSPALQLLQFKE